MNEDLIIVYIGNTLDRRADVPEAARRAWVVADSKAGDLKWLIAVTAHNRVEGVFEIVGYNSLGRGSGTRNRVEFDLIPTDRQVRKSLAGMTIQGNMRGEAAEYLSGEDAARTGSGGGSGD